MIRDILSRKSWSDVDKAKGKYLQIRPDEVLVFSRDTAAGGPKFTIDYNEAVGVTFDDNVLKNLRLHRYRSGELHIAATDRKPYWLYVTRTPQGGIFISGKKPAGWD